METYLEFLRSKIVLAKESGFELDPGEVNPGLKPHQRDAVVWVPLPWKPRRPGGRFSRRGRKEDRMRSWTDDRIPERPLEPPEPEENPRCPCCGEECETLCRDRVGRIVGCENCVDTLDAWEYRHLAV